MAWLTTKDGRHFNTDWIDKEKQIEKNKQEANERKATTTKYKDSLSYDDFFKQNFDTLKRSYMNKEIDDPKGLWRSIRLKKEQENLKELSVDEAYDLIDKAIPHNYISGWFRNADSDYKPKILDLALSNKGVVNAMLNVAYFNYRWQYERYSEYNKKWIPFPDVNQSGKLSFSEWVNKPITLYRGTRGQRTVKSDLFDSYSPDINIAKKFAGNDGKVESIKIAPSQTLGSMFTNGEQEILVLRK